MKGRQDGAATKIKVIRCSNCSKMLFLKTIPTTSPVQDHPSPPCMWIHWIKVCYVAGALFFVLSSGNNEDDSSDAALPSKGEESRIEPKMSKPRVYFPKAQQMKIHVNQAGNELKKDANEFPVVSAEQEHLAHCVPIAKNHEFNFQSTERLWQWQLRRPAEEVNAQKTKTTIGTQNHDGNASLGPMRRSVVQAAAVQQGRQTGSWQKHTTKQYEI